MAEPKRPSAEALTRVREMAERLHIPGDRRLTDSELETIAIFAEQARDDENEAVESDAGRRIELEAKADPWSGGYRTALRQMQHFVRARRSSRRG